MAARIVALLIALAVLAGAGAMFLLRDQEKSSSNASALGQALFPQLKAADVARVVITDAAGSINLERKEGRWVIAERGGFAADTEKVGEFVVKLLELKTGQVEPIGEKDRARMQLAAPAKAEAPKADPAKAEASKTADAKAEPAKADAAKADAAKAESAKAEAPKAGGSATVVSLKAADGKVLAELLVGKKYFKTAPEGDASKAQGDGRYVMLPADPARVIVVADPLRQATSSTADWVSKAGISVGEVKSLEVKLGEGGYRMAREKPDTAWVLDGKGGELDQSRATSASYALSSVEVADVAAAGVDTGVDGGAEVTAVTFEGLTYRVQFGRSDGDRRYAKITVEGTPERAVRAAPVPADEKKEDREKREKAAADEAKKFDERIAREKALAGFTVLVTKGKLDDVMRDRPAMLKQEAPKEDARMDEGKKGAAKKK
jgi:hypothetical protein